MTCAVHTLNGLLQKRAFSVVDLGEVLMDSDDSALLGGKKARNDKNVGMDGNIFIVQVQRLSPALLSQLTYSSAANTREPPAASSNRSISKHMPPIK